jgi:hypothetical protein
MGLERGMKQQDYQRQYYQLRKARGCFDCGKPKRSESTRCHQCARDHAAKAKELYDTNQVTKMKQEPKPKTVVDDEIITAVKPKRVGLKKIKSSKSTGDKIHKAAISRGLAATKGAYNHKTAKAIFLRVNQLSEKFVSPFGLGLGEL